MSQVQMFSVAAHRNIEEQGVLRGNERKWKEMKGKDMEGNERKWKDMITANSKKTLEALYRCSKRASQQLGERVRLHNVSGKSMNFG